MEDELGELLPEEEVLVLDNRAALTLEASADGVAARTTKLR